MKMRPSSFASRPSDMTTTHTGILGTGRGRAQIVLAVGQGALAYALLAPKLFVTRHPVWGTVVAVLAVLNLADAVSD
jgi:hypothetical protein